MQSFSVGKQVVHIIITGLFSFDVKFAVTYIISRTKNILVGYLTTRAVSILCSVGWKNNRWIIYNLVFAVQTGYFFGFFLERLRKSKVIFNQVIHDSAEIRTQLLKNRRLERYGYCSYAYSGCYLQEGLLSVELLSRTYVAFPNVSLLSIEFKQELDSKYN
jgi:hypothetical protein